MHYNTTHLIRQNPSEFKMLVNELELGTEVRILEPGTILKFKEEVFSPYILLGLFYFVH